MTTDGKKPLSAWAHWRGPIDVNRFIPAGMATEWEGKLWCGSDRDREALRVLMEADARQPKPAPPKPAPTQ